MDVHSAQGGMGGYLTPDEVRACIGGCTHSAHCDELHRHAESGKYVTRR